MTMVVKNVLFELYDNQSANHAVTTVSTTLDELFHPEDDESFDNLLEYLEVKFDEARIAAAPVANVVVVANTLTSNT